MAVTNNVETGAPPALDFVGEVAQQIRVDGIRASTKAGSGHPTSSMSAADLIAVLAARHLRYDFAHPIWPTTTTSSSRRGTPRHSSTVCTRRSARSPTRSS